MSNFMAFVAFCGKPKVCIKMPKPRSVQIFISAVAAMAILMLAGCQTSAKSSEISHDPSPSRYDASAPSLSAYYLIARQALYENDLPSASDAFHAGLALDKTSESLLKQAFFIHYQNGELAKAEQIARALENRNIGFPLSVEPAIGTAILNQDWQAVLALATKLQSDQLYIGFATALRSFAYAGLGEFEIASGEIDKLSGLFPAEAQAKPNAYITILRGLLADLLKRSEEAALHYDAVLRAPGNSAFIAIKASMGLARLGKADQAMAILQDKLSSNFNLEQLGKLLKAKYGPTAAPLALQDAFSAVFLLSPSLLPGDELDTLILPRTHLGYALCLDCNYAAYRLGQTLAHLGDIENSFAYLDEVNLDTPWAQPAFLVKLSTLDDSGRRDDAISLIDNIIAQINQPQHADATFIQPYRLYQLAGNLHRYQGACDTAIPYYLEAENRRPQALLTMRGLAICYEQTGHDEKAETLFRAVLKQAPDDALTLNYLGYWWADDGRHLDEAIALIKKAVALQPSSGFYADSLGWVYYRLGQMNDAIEWLERAIQLAPTDAIISDHLADAYWAVGRHLEARYKWQHALDLGLDGEELENTRKKLSDAITIGTKSTQ